MNEKSLGGYFFMRHFFLAFIVIFSSSKALSEPVDPAVAFGARPYIESIALSPDGRKIAYVTPSIGQASRVVVIDLADPSKMTVALASSGKPERLGSCGWISDSRIACGVYGVVNDGVGLNYFTRTIAVNWDGSAPKMLSTRQSGYAEYAALGGGQILDTSTGQEGHVLMSRVYVPEGRIGTIVSKAEEGLGVDDVDSVTMQTKRVVKPIPDAVRFMTDGKGQVRIMATADQRADYLTGVYKYRFRAAGASEWQPLSDYSSQTGAGFMPVAIDAKTNSVIGLDKLNGRKAVYRMALDGSGQRTLLYSHDRVDVDGVETIGRTRRPVAVSYATDRRYSVYFDPALDKLTQRLAKALPDVDLLDIIDSSADESKLLIAGSSDRNPGIYYLLDRTSNKMQPLFAARPQLSGFILASVKSVEVTAADGTKVPAYLTLPPGSDGRNLPALVMPHGGPSARDEWGFDWLAQFFAHKGYAVLQPNYRGSSGFGDDWYQNNGFKSWAVAIGDVTGSGRWLVAQGIADPKKLAIFGWSYGGYAALQSGVVAPDLFKAIIAIAPVTDLQLLRQKSGGYLNSKLVKDFIGTGPHLKDGSPAQNARRITAPVMIVQGLRDVNVDAGQAKLMVDRLKDAGHMAEYMEVPDLDHYMEDSSVRRDMLARSADFLTAHLPK